MRDVTGADKDCAQMKNARRFIKDNGGAVGIPSWGVCSAVFRLLSYGVRIFTRDRRAARRQVLAVGARRVRMAGKCLQAFLD